MSDWPKDYGESRPDPWETCHICEGEGEIIDPIHGISRQCPNCGGKGEIPDPNLSQWEQDSLWAQRNKY